MFSGRVAFELEVENAVTIRVRHFRKKVRYGTPIRNLASTPITPVRWRINPSITVPT